MKNALTQTETGLLLKAILVTGRTMINGYRTKVMKTTSDILYDLMGKDVPGVASIYITIGSIASHYPSNMIIKALIDNESTRELLNNVYAATKESWYTVHVDWLPNSILTATVSVDESYVYAITPDGVGKPYTTSTLIPVEFFKKESPYTKCHAELIIETIHKEMEGIYVELIAQRPRE